MDIVLRTAVVFVFVFVLMRAISRSELSQMQPFDLLLLVVLGDLITQGALQSDMSVTGAMLATGTFALLSLGVSYLWFSSRGSDRSSRASRWWSSMTERCSSGTCGGSG